MRPQKALGNKCSKSNFGKYFDPCHSMMNNKFPIATWDKITVPISRETKDDATTVLHKSMQNGTNKTRKEQLKTVGPQFAPERSLCMMGWQGKIHDKPIEHVIFVILSGAVCSLELCVCFVQFHSFCDPGFKMKRAERSAMAAFELCAWVRK